MKKSLTGILMTALALLSGSCFAQPKFESCVENLIQATETNTIADVILAINTFEANQCVPLLKAMGIKTPSNSRIAFALYTQSQKRIVDAQRPPPTLSSSGSTANRIPPITNGPGAVGHIRIDPAFKLPNVKDK
jgi:hypothetical protein